MKRLSLVVALIILVYPCFSQGLTIVSKCEPTTGIEITSLKDTLCVKVYDNIKPPASKNVVKETTFEEIEESIFQSISKAFPNAVIVKEAESNVLTANIRIEEYYGGFYGGGWGVSGFCKYTVVVVNGEDSRKKVLEERCGGAVAMGKYAGRRQLKRAFDAVNEQLFKFIAEASNKETSIFDD